MLDPPVLPTGPTDPFRRPRRTAPGADVTDTAADPGAHRRRPLGRPDGPADLLRPAGRHRGRRRGRRRLGGRGDGPPPRAGRGPDGPADAEHGRGHGDRPDQGRAPRDRDRDDDLVHRGGEGHLGARGRCVRLRPQGRRGRGGRRGRPGRVRRRGPPRPGRRAPARPADAQPEDRPRTSSPSR